jgi:hypothetical protein
VVFSTNKTDCHDITEILLKVVLNTINKHKKNKYWRELVTTKDLMVDETGVFCENLQPAASQQQTLAVLTQFNFTFKFASSFITTRDEFEA